MVNVSNAQATNAHDIALERISGTTDSINSSWLPGRQCSAIILLNAIPGHHASRRAASIVRRLHTACPQTSTLVNEGGCKI